MCALNNAYQPEILENLRKAISYVNTIAAEVLAAPLFLTTLGKNLMFYEVTGQTGLNQLNLGEDLGQSSFHAPGHGVYGSLKKMDFRPQGLVTIRTASVDHDTGTVTWTETEGRWTLVREMSSVYVDIQPLGASVMRYLLKYNDSYTGFHLVPVGEDFIPQGLSSEPDECSA